MGVPKLYNWKDKPKDVRKNKDWYMRRNATLVADFFAGCETWWLADRFGVSRRRVYYIVEDYIERLRNGQEVYRGGNKSRSNDQ